MKSNKKDVGVMAFTQISEIEKDRNKYIYVFNCGYFLIHNKKTTLEELNSPSGYLVVYLHKGSLEIQIGNTFEHVEAGHVFVFQPTQIRNIVFNDNESNERYFIYFQGDGSYYYLKQLGLTDRIIYKCGDLTSHLHIFSDIIKDFKLNDFQHDVNRTIYLLSFLSAVGDTIKAKPTSDNKALTEINKVIDLMRTHYGENKPLEFYAEQYNASISTFIRHFKQHTGISPIKYLNNIKIEIGKSFLTNTNLSISEISYNLGIDNPLYFCNFFKNNVGTSPTKYREENSVVNQNTDL